MTKINQFDDATMRRILEMVREWMRTAVSPNYRSPPFNNADSNHIMQTKSGGIPARSGATCGKALCTLMFIDDDDELVSQKDGQGVAIERMVWNMSADAVAGTTYIQAKLVANKLVVDWEDCE